jgi:hypothetical protein
MYVVLEALKHKFVGDITAVAINNKQSFVSLLCRLCLRDKDLLKPQSRDVVISPALLTACKVPILQEVKEVRVFRKPRLLNCLSFVDDKRRQCFPRGRDTLNDCSLVC